MVDGSCSREVLLAWINHRLEVISQAQHQLAVHKTVLQEQATRLRLGTPVDEVQLTLKRANISARRGRRLGEPRSASGKQGAFPPANRGGNIS
jgi:hypothetical protein